MKTVKEELKQIKRRNEVFRTLQDLVEPKGFLKVESDSFEEYASYLQQNPRQNSKELVKVADLRGNMYFLKPDITTNLIKQVIPRMNQGEQVKLYYIDSVYNYSAEGKITSTRQFGVELIGQNGIQSDTMLLGLVKELLGKFDLRYVIELGNQEWLNIIFSELNLTTEEEVRVKQALIAKNQDLISSILKEEKKGYVALLNASIRYQNDFEVLKSLIESKSLNQKLLTIIDSMEKLQSDVNDPSIEIDLSMINEFDYYNGPIFKLYINDYKKDVLRGGRYDYLTKDYGKLTPALGFSLDLDVLIEEVSK